MFLKFTIIIIIIIKEKHLSSANREKDEAPKSQLCSCTSSQKSTSKSAAPVSSRPQAPAEDVHNTLQIKKEMMLRWPQKSQLPRISKPWGTSGRLPLPF